MNILDSNKVAQVYNIKHQSSPIVKIVFITIALLFILLFLIMPLVIVFKEAFANGYNLYIKSIIEPAALSAIKLSLIAAVISLILNTFFGICFAWAVTRFNFKGKGLLLTLLDLPFTISPVISGMMFVMFLGAGSILGSLFNNLGIEIIFAAPGVVIATAFVTFPYIARELIPQMLESGIEEEEAAKLLGASGFKIFYRITLPNIKWSLFYGLVLCNARAIGEFGAVSVVSGHIRGLTNTIPLHIEILYNEYNFSAAFAVASILTLLALITLILKNVIQWVSDRNL